MTEARDERGRGGGGLSPEEAARLSEHVAGVARSGLPLGPGLRALAEESGAGSFRRSLLGLAEAVERGVPLEEAVEGEAGSIPPHLRGLIRAGLRSGELGDVLGRFSAVASIGAELKRSFWVGLAYPMLAVALACVLFVLVDSLIVSKFEEIFRDFGISLPAMTMILLQVSRAVRAGWPLLLTLFLIVVSAWVLGGLVLSPARRNSLFARIPVVGILWRYTAWTEFCHLLAILLESRIPMPEALRLTGGGVEDADVEIACRAMAARVERGESLSAAMAGGRAAAPSGPFDHLAAAASPPPKFEGAAASPPPRGGLAASAAGERAILRAMPSGLPRLLRWAEERAATAEVLHMAGETFQARSRAEAAFGGAVLAFLAMVAVFIGIAVIVIGLFLPLITLLSRLSG